MNKKKIAAIATPIVSIILAIAVFLGISGFNEKEPYSTSSTAESKISSYSLESVPDYNGKPYVYINGNLPEFSDSEITTQAFEKYGRLDKLRRCTSCVACVGQELMPTGERESISAIKPTGWQTVRYNFIDGESLYNRCHLIAYMLTGENANENNLITGTRYMNTEGMLPFEEKVCSYVKATDNHVMYRVTPIFDSNELVARGVHMEGYSVEDKGKGISFNVYCYNVQPNITIDYKTGRARLTNSDKKEKSATYILNTSSKKFHKPDCEKIADISEHNKKTFKGKRSDLTGGGYEPCGACRP